MLVRISRISLIFFAIFFFSATSLEAALVNINTAGTEELKTLTGIGDVKAQAIVDYRIQNGVFSTIEDIMDVSGIGTATFESIKSSITVGNTTNNSESNTNTTSGSGSTQSNTSAHYSASSITTSSKSTSKIEISAGRDRLGTAGSPMEFLAETNISNVKASAFTWNFGDGSQGGGKVISHTYLYPGEYVVILTVTGEEGVVARANVEIVDPKLSITHISPERVEIMNSSTKEVNLYGRALVSLSQAFNFPKDTIIKSGQKISFGASVTGLKILNQAPVMIVVIGNGMHSMEISAMIEEEKQKEIERISNELSTLQSELIKMGPESIQESREERVVVNELVEDKETQLATVITAPEIPANPLSRFFGAIKRFFLRTE